MKTYLVGGAVRDRLLGFAVKDRDWLVLDATAAELTRLGYQRVGKDFPVFLHPETHEEHAFPRAEGLSGEPALEADLCHRDLTINALAEGPDGELVDPCGGLEDLENRRLRHTPAFPEDPIRVLRLARFAARLHGLGFQVAAETRLLCWEMADTGGLDELVAERVWAEIVKALGESQPAVFFETLHELGALKVILPELDRLFGVPQRAEYHPEVDTGRHTLMVLEQASRLSADPKVRFAALVHDLGKGETPESVLPRHYGHEEASARLIRNLCNRLRIPNDWRDLAVQAGLNHGKAHRAFELRPKTLLKLLNAFDALRRPQRFENFLLVCEADSRGRTGFEDRPYPAADYLRAMQQAAAAIDARTLARETPEGQSVAERIQRARQRAIAEAIRAWRDASA